MSLPFLYERQNPHAPKRANGLRFHGYPSRKAGRRPNLVVLHTSESVLDRAGLDGGAESVARYQSTTTRPSSYHRLHDSDSTVVTLPDEATAFGAVGANARGLQAALAMQTTAWQSTDPETVRRRELALERLARTVAEWCARYGIPVRHLTRAQYLAGEAGIVGHADVDPARRSDPGRYFPWPRFLDRVRQLLASPTSPPTAPTPKGLPTMLLVQEPNGPRVFLIDADPERATHLNGAERDGYLEAGVPFLNGDTPAQLDRRYALLERRRVPDLKRPVAAPPPPPAAPRLLRRGDEGEDVRAVQRAVGVTPDGDYGPNTEAAVKRAQAAAGITADGIVGPATRRVLKL